MIVIMWYIIEKLRNVIIFTNACNSLKLQLEKFYFLDDRHTEITIAQNSICDDDL